MRSVSLQFRIPLSLSRTGIVPAIHDSRGSALGGPVVPPLLVRCLGHDRRHLKHRTAGNFGFGRDVGAGVEVQWHQEDQEQGQSKRHGSKDPVSLIARG